MATYQIPPGLDLTKIPVLTPPPGHPYGVFMADMPRERSFLAVTIVMSVVSFLFIAGRLYLNYFDKARKLSWDDAFCVIGWMFSVGFTATWTTLRRYFRHAWDFPLSWFDEHYFKTLFASFCTLPPAQFFTKGAFIILYLRIFSPQKTVRWLLYVLFVFSFCAYFVALPVFTYYCTPRPGHSWTLENVPQCNNANVMGPILGALNALIDLLLLVIPLVVVSRLRLNKRRRYELMAIFLTGILAVAAGIVGLAYRIVSWKFGKGGADVNFYNYYQLLSAMIELFISAICSSMPAYATFSKKHIIPYIRKLLGIVPSSFKLSSRSDNGHETSIPHVQTHAPVLETPNFGTTSSVSNFTGRGHLEFGPGKKGGKTGSSKAGDSNTVGSSTLQGSSKGDSTTVASSTWEDEKMYGRFG